MAQYQKKPRVIEATQWFKNGDHPEDCCEIGKDAEGPFQGEGKVVRYYRGLECDPTEECKKCNNIMALHGWIDSSERGQIVCPGDFIITEFEDEYYPCKPDIFEETYEKVLKVWINGKLIAPK